MFQDDLGTQVNEVFDYMRSVALLGELPQVRKRPSEDEADAPGLKTVFEEQGGAGTGSGKDGNR